MKKLIFSLVLLSLSLLSRSQDRLSVLVNLTQSNNNFAYSDIVGDVELPNLGAPIILSAHDQYGISVRKSYLSDFFYELSILGSRFQRSLENLRPYHQFYEERRVFLSKMTDLRMRIEAGKSFSFENLPNLHFAMSISVDPRISYLDVEPFLTDLYQVQVTSYEIGFFLNPQIEYTINKRINFLVKIPLQVWSLNSLFGTYRNPNLPFADQNINQHISRIFRIKPTYSFGVGYYITYFDR